MGTGKSLIALHTVAGHETCLVVCPAFLRQNWRDEISKWTQGGKFTVISYDFLARNDVGYYDACICDEFHYVKNKDAKRTLALYSWVVHNKPKTLIGLTGTPIKNRVTDFWAPFKILLRDKMGLDYWGFANTFSHRRDIRIKGRNVTKYEGLRNTEKLKAFIKPFLSRTLAKNVLDLPDQVYREISIADKRFDKDLKIKVDLYLKENSLTKNMASTKLVNATAKVRHTIELANTILESGKPVIIFTDHVKPCNEIARMFHVEPIHGESTADRSRIVKDFNEGRQDVIVATIPSLSVGVNLTRCNHMIFNDYSYIPAEMAQAEKRIHRIGQKGTCFYYYLFAGALDRYIHNMLKEKSLISKKVLDKD